MKNLKIALRKLFRAKRRELFPAVRQDYSEQVTRLLSQQDEFTTAKRIALYMALPEELQTTGVLSLALAADKVCTVPVLTQSNTLLFAIVDAQTIWHDNRYGILEPDQPESNLVDPTSLDVVIVPLVSFDAMGNRLGMGAGYYDKTFAFRRHESKPFLIGMAFECQRHTQLPMSEMDICLDMVVTEKQCYRFTKK